MRALTPVALAAALLCVALAAKGQTSTPAAETPVTALPSVTVRASADASAEGLSPAYPGGQVARGGRAGILGSRDQMDTPFSIVSYTNELIQDRHAKSVGDVLQNDPTVRTARGFGNFQESYFIRGFLLGSDDVAFNGLYSLLPRQYIATELFERVEVLRGASTFLNGANPNDGGIGGAINLVPKRAPNEPLTRATVTAGSGSQVNVSTDIARRFGPDQSTGVRFNAALRDGGSAVEDEKAKLALLALGLDWRSSDVRLSADLGWQDNKLKRTRPNVTLTNAVTEVPDAPDGSSNFAQPWSYSNERDLFGTLRGEVDLSSSVTAWGAYGLRRSDEANSLANLDVSDGRTGAATTYRFDNTREDKVDTGEIGVRGKLRTGPVGHEWVVSASYFEGEQKNAFVWGGGNILATNLYTPRAWARPDFTAGTVTGNDLHAPALTLRTRLTSVAVGDTLAFADDRVLLTLGLRHQKLDITNYAYDTGAESDRYRKSRTSPMAGLVYKASKQLSFYGNYIEGLTQGDTEPNNDDDPTDQPKVLSPYVSKQKELGLKYDSGRLGGGLALFSTSKPRSLTNADGVFTAEGEDRHRGVEVTVYGKASSRLRLLGGMTWLDAKQRTTGVADTEGKRVIGVPKFQANLGAEWDVAGITGLAVDGRVVHTGASYAKSDNTLRVPGWTRLDVGARYMTDVQGKLVTLRARIDNLTDRSYWASVGGYPEAGYLVVGAPRTFSLSASVDF
ncbi:TonB-dependent receptor [Aquabacterium sp. A7-Y]|uniref:TonB-dependent receptor n=1 Tax=Aquabacterium sp. A7-Y TaxID=1349605 RepID=UPI00223D7F88|nr:TonB-dependent receptor [Aquabacterium sp. A7-Y]MCW7540414.1 TonB-dependent receptor [Aquabacterium sp. A7-Y]